MGPRVEELNTVTRERLDAPVMTEHGDGDRGDERDRDGGDQHRTPPTALPRLRLARARLRHRLQEVRRIVSLRHDLDHSDRFLESLQLDGAAIDVDDAVDLPREMHDFRAREDLAGTGLTAEAGGQVQGTAAEAARDRHRFARIQADPHREWKRGVGERLFHEPRLQVERRADRLASGGEDGENFIATELDHRAPARSDRLLSQIGELRCQLGRRLVASFMGEQGPAPDVRDQERADLGVVVAHGRSIPPGLHRREARLAWG